MRLIELLQKILLIRLMDSALFLNGKQTKERVFRSKPSDNFKWNQLKNYISGSQMIYAHLSLQEMKDMLNKNINSIYANDRDSLSEEELFKPHMRKWADEELKQLSGKYINSYILTQLFHSEPLELRLEN